MINQLSNKQKADQIRIGLAKHYISRNREYVLEQQSGYTPNIIRQAKTELIKEGVKE